MTATTVARVSRHTTAAINDRIRRRIEAYVACYATASPAAIQARLRALDAEWDIERCLETMSSGLTLIGMLLGFTVRRRWLAVPVLVQAFFLQHALDGWCPPLPVLRRLGVRTAQEIQHERYALKVLRGDFREVAQSAAVDPRAVLGAVRR
jgi:hypothetical protein